MDGRESALVSYETALEALEQHGGKVPGNPKVEVHLGPRLEDGSCELTISGSPHASLENVIRNLGLRELQPKSTVITSLGRSPSAQAYVSAEPATRDQDDPGRRKAATKRQRRKAAKKS